MIHGNVHNPFFEENGMSNKEIAIDLIQRLPDDVSLRQIAEEIRFIAAVREGLKELDDGKGVPLEEVEKRLPSWLTK
jgi:hypothetical protein